MSTRIPRKAIIKLENGIDFRVSFLNPGNLNAIRIARSSCSDHGVEGIIGVIFVYSPDDDETLEFVRKKFLQLQEMRKEPPFQCVLAANESVEASDEKFENWESEGKKLAKKLQKYSGECAVPRSKILFYLQRAHAVVGTQTNIMQRIMAFVPHNDLPFFSTNFWMHYNGENKNTDKMCLRIATMIYRARRRSTASTKARCVIV